MELPSAKIVSKEESEALTLQKLSGFAIQMGHKATPGTLSPAVSMAVNTAMPEGWLTGG